MIRCDCSANSTTGCAARRPLGDEGLPDTPAADDDTYWTAFVQGDDGYLAEVTIDESIAFDALAAKLRGRVDAVAPASGRC